MKKKYIYAILVIISLFYIEQVLELNYLLKTLIKLPLFGIVPWLIIRPMKLHMSTHDKKWMAIVSGGILFVFLVGFIALKGFLDIETIQGDFNNRMEMSKGIFILAALYTVFVNSFLEELFFRGMLFQSNPTNYHNIVSAMCFAIYHVSIFRTWFNIPLLMLMLFGLFTGGIIFNYFVKKTGSLLASYMIHMTADIAIVIIGFQVLNYF
ncbi:MAG: CPBP family intramembrane metalloprotease [Clostridia bacterium]|nr:CPBP family intramembrane metalloprotease [Clostridia bacterium]